MCIRDRASSDHLAAMSSSKPFFLDSNSTLGAVKIHCRWFLPTEKQLHVATMAFNDKPSLDPAWVWLFSKTTFYKNVFDFSRHANLTSRWTSAFPLHSLCTTQGYICPAKIRVLEQNPSEEQKVNRFPFAKNGNMHLALAAELRKKRDCEIKFGTQIRNFSCDFTRTVKEFSTRYRFATGDSSEVWIVINKMQTPASILSLHIKHKPHQSH